MVRKQNQSGPSKGQKLCISAFHGNCVLIPFCIVSFEKINLASARADGKAEITLK